MRSLEPQLPPTLPAPTCNINDVLDIVYLCVIYGTLRTPGVLI